MKPAAQRHLAIDLGASSGRVIEVVVSADRVESLRELHRFANGPVPVPRGDGLRWLWPFESIWNGVLDGLRVAARDRTPIDSIGIDSWAVDYGLVDREGSLVAPVAAYRDPRTQAPMARIRAALTDDAIYAQTGIAFQPFNTLYQLAADAADPSGPLDRADRMLLIPDLIAHRLCGSAVGERTNAGTTQCFDGEAGEGRGAWIDSFVQAAGVPSRILPEVVPAGTVLGSLRPSIAALVGLPASTRVVATASHDTASAVAAAPIEAAGDVYVSSGTWSLVGVEIARPIRNRAAMEAGLTNEPGAHGATRLLRNVAGLWILQECRRRFETDGRASSWSDLAAAAEAEQAFRSVIDPDDPRFAAPGLDMPDRVRAWCREHGEPSPEGDAAIVRTILDSLAIATADAARRVAAVAGTPLARIAIVGGGVANRLLDRLIAEAADAPVVLGSTEATAIGNALVQHAALGGAGGAEAAQEVRRLASTIGDDGRECLDPTGSFGQSIGAARGRLEAARDRTRSDLREP